MRVGTKKESVECNSESVKIVKPSSTTDLFFSLISFIKFLLKLDNLSLKLHFSQLMHWRCLC